MRRGEASPGGHSEVQLGGEGVTCEPLSQSPPTHLPSCTWLLAAHPGRPGQEQGTGLLANDGELLANSKANTRRINIVEKSFGAACQPLTLPDRF